MNALTHFLASIRNRNDEGQDLLGTHCSSR